MQNPLFIDRAITFKLSVNVLVDKQAKARRLHILSLSVLYLLWLHVTSLLKINPSPKYNWILFTNSIFYWANLTNALQWKSAKLRVEVTVFKCFWFCFVFLVCFLVNNLLTRSIYSISFSVILFLIIRYHLTLSWGDIFILRIQQVARQTHFFNI